MATENDFIAWITGGPMKTRNWDQMCQALVWQLCDNFGSAPVTYESAELAYQAPETKIVSFNAADAPFGAIHWWREPQPWGHVAMGLGNGRCVMASAGVDVSLGNHVGIVGVDSYTARKGYTYRGWSYTNGRNSVSTTNQEDFLVALSQYDQELTRNVSVETVETVRQMKKTLDALASGALPTANGYPFPARDAVQNNLEMIAGTLRALAAKDTRIDQAALGKQIAEALKPTIVEAVKQAGSGASADQIVDKIADRLAH